MVFVQQAYGQNRQDSHQTTKISILIQDTVQKPPFLSRNNCILNLTFVQRTNVSYCTITVDYDITK